jgi:hypothetical protein
MSTSARFAIEQDSPTSAFLPVTAKVSAPKRLPYLAMGSLILLLGSAPAGSSECSAPSAVRPLLASTDVGDGEIDVEELKPPAGIERGIARLTAFRQYSADWDDLGASVANAKAIDEAIAYLSLLEAWHPIPLATLSREGLPILEFDDVDKGGFSSVTFLGDGRVELYDRHGSDRQSRFLATHLGSDEAEQFLLNVMNLPAI